AAATWLAARRRWRSLAALAAVLLPLWALWSLRVRRVGGGDYMEQFLSIDPYNPARGRIGLSELVSRMGENLARYVEVHLPILLIGRTATIATILALVVVVLALIGWAIRLRRPGIAELFLPLYIGLLMVWPAVWSGERFLVPALPVVLAFAGAALLELTRRVAPRRTALVGAAAAALVLILALPQLRSAIRAGFNCTTRHVAGEYHPCLPPAYRGFFELAEWSAGVLPPDAAVISRKPTLFYWLSGRRSTIYPTSTRTQDFFEHARETGSRYLVFDRLDGLSLRYVLPVLAAHADAFCLVHATPQQDAALFELAADAAESEPREPPLSGELGFRSCPPAPRRVP
ncbi:MAG: hypothetical protein ACRELD_16405, partial [Longimicrobiales bacterium]